MRDGKMESKIETKIENHSLRINIMDLFDNMSEEDLKEIGTYYMWDSEVYKNLAYEMKHNLASKSYNESLFNLEKAFFTMEEKEYAESDWEKDQFKDSVFYTMRQAMKSILEENAQLHAEIYKHNSARSKIYNLVQQKYGDDIAYYVNSMYVSEEYSNPHAYELARDMASKVDIARITELWVDAMIARFNPDQ